MTTSTPCRRSLTAAALLLAGALVAGRGLSFADSSAAGPSTVEPPNAESPNAELPNAELPSAESSTPEQSTSALPPVERLVYRWRLQGLVGFVARLFIPGRGEGLLETRPSGEGRLLTELRITSAKAGEEEYWIYGSTIDPESGRTVSAFNESLFRGRERHRAAELEGDEILDVPSGIRFLRQARPRSPVRRRLWADGKIYPVEFRLQSRETRQVSGRSIAADLYSVRGVRLEGERFWDGGLDVWLSTGEPPLPLEILYRSGRGRVDLELLDPPTD